MSEQRNQADLAAPETTYQHNFENTSENDTAFIAVISTLAQTLFDAPDGKSLEGQLRGWFATNRVLIQANLPELWQLYYDHIQEVAIKLEAKASDEQDRQTGIIKELRLKSRVRKRLQQASFKGLDGETTIVQDYFRDLELWPLLTPFQEKALLILLQEMKQVAATEVISMLKTVIARANLRLAISIAKHFQGRGVPLIDLIQEGNLGLLKAISRFDVRKNVKLSTYATWWIRQRSSRAPHEQARVIRYSVHTEQQLSNLFIASDDYMKLHGELPDSMYIADALNITEARAEYLLKLLANDPLSLERLAEGEGHNDTTTDEMLPVFTIAGSTELSPEEGILAKERIALLNEALAAGILNEKESKLVTDYFFNRIKLKDLAVAEGCNIRTMVARRRTALDKIIRYFKSHGGMD